MFNCTFYVAQLQLHLPATARAICCASDPCIPWVAPATTDTASGSVHISAVHDTAGVYSLVASLHHQRASNSSACLCHHRVAISQLPWWWARASPTLLTQQIYHSQAAAATGTTWKAPDTYNTVCHRHLGQQQLVAAVAAATCRSVEDPPGLHSAGQKFFQPKGVGQLR